MGFFVGTRRINIEVLGRLKLFHLEIENQWNHSVFGPNLIVFNTKPLLHELSKFKQK